MKPARPPKRFWEGAEMIHSYSRAQAIADGVLVDVSAVAAEAGIKHPVALTRAVWSRYVEVPEGVELQDEQGRLWDVLYMLAQAARRIAGSQFLYKLHVRNDNRERTPPLVTLKAICGPGDTAAPVITVLLPEED